MAVSLLRYREVTHTPIGMKRVWGGEVLWKYPHSCYNLLYIHFTYVQVNLLTIEHAPCNNGLPWSYILVQTCFESWVRSLHTYLTQPATSYLSDATSYFILIWSNTTPLATSYLSGSTQHDQLLHSYLVEHDTTSYFILIWSNTTQPAYFSDEYKHMPSWTT